MRQLRMRENSAAHPNQIPTMFPTHEILAPRSRRTKILLSTLLALLFLITRYFSHDWAALSVTCAAVVMVSALFLKPNPSPSSQINPAPVAVPSATKCQSPSSCCQGECKNESTEVNIAQPPPPQPEEVIRQVGDIEDSDFFLNYANIVMSDPQERRESEAPVQGMVSVLQLFKVGVGPSSSHTVGPMKAANLFVSAIGSALSQVKRVGVDLYGSLALTGVGHGTDTAIMLGLMGNSPENVNPTNVLTEVDRVRKGHVIELGKTQLIDFDPKKDIVFHKQECLPFHTNGVKFAAFDENGRSVTNKTYYSVGGGFVLDDDDVKSGTHMSDDAIEIPYPFDCMEDLLAICDKLNMTIAQVVMENERAWRGEEETKAGIVRVWEVMKECMQRGLTTTGHLPGFLNVRRRAPLLHARLMGRARSESDGAAHSDEPEEEEERLEGSKYLKWLSVYAMAVNEENAAGGRVVTAPTNGAAGVIPGVLHYYQQHKKQKTPLTLDELVKFFCTATAVGYLFKIGASISGAESGCQGEVGVASSMAAAGLAALMGASNKEVENAAEIAMEHHLGLTCDPVGGLVQIPCIERNAMGAVKAVNAALLAMDNKGDHVVSLDKVIRVMKRTGDDMQSKYKETSLGGLALEFEQQGGEETEGRFSVAHILC